MSSSSSSTQILSDQITLILYQASLIPSTPWSRQIGQFGFLSETSYNYFLKIWISSVSAYV